MMEALAKAMSEENIPKIIHLLERGVDDDTKNFHFHRAILSDNLEIVRLFLKHGANANFVYENLTAIHWNTCTHVTPLHFASREGDIEVCKLLLQYGANVNAVDTTQMTPLYYAILSKNVLTVRLLLENGANTKLVSTIYFTPLQWAVFCANKEIVELLLMHGAPVNFGNRFNQTPLLFYKKTEEGIIDVLLQYNADIHATNCWGESALHCMVKNMDHENARRLLQCGIDVNLKTHSDDSPLQYAVRRGELQMINLLLQYEADVNSVHISSLQHLNQETSADVVYILLMHIYKLYSLNMHVNLEHMDFFNRERRNAEISMKVQNETFNCEIEMQKIKNWRFGEKYFISLYQVVTNPLHQVALYLQNEDIKSKLETVDYITQFPLYSYLIQQRVRTCIQKAYIINKTFDILSSIINNAYSIPTLCIHKIMSYFDDNNMRFLINCYTDASENETST